MDTLSVFVNREDTLSVLVNRQDEDNWLASLDLVDIKTSKTLGILDADHEDQLTACIKLARFCLTLGYRGILLFYDDTGSLISRANLSGAKVVMRPTNKKTSR